MKAFLYGIALQWKLDIRSKTLLITCYIVPLLFFGVMGSIFTSVMPDSKETLIQSMTIFGVTMGALIGVPPSLAEIYRSDVKKNYRANGVPLYLGIVSINISAFLHLWIMSAIICIAAPLAFDAGIPENSGLYLAGLAVFTAASLAIASIIGLAVKDPTKTSMFSILIFLPSIMLSGIMFPVNLLPGSLETAGKFFPASWGYRCMTEQVFHFELFLPLLFLFAAAVIICAILLRRVSK